MYEKLLRINSLTFVSELFSINEKVVDRAEFLSRFGLDKNKISLLAVGHFIAIKNHLFLIDLMPKLGNQCQLAIIGEGPLQSAYLKRIHDLGFEKVVKILGPLPPEELLDWYKVVDIVVHPSLSEGIPNVVLEAMAAKKPVVASNVGGLPEVIEDGVSGYLIHPDDIDRYVEVLNNLIGDPRKREQIGKAAYDYLLKNNYTWKAQTEKVMTIFHQLLEEQKPKPIRQDLLKK